MINPSFQGSNEFFVLLFSDNKNYFKGEGHTCCYHKKVQIKDFNVKIDMRRSFDQTIRNDIKIYESNRINDTGQGDH